MAVHFLSLWIYTDKHILCGYLMVIEIIIVLGVKHKSNNNIMKHIRINKLLRYGDDLSVDVISSLLGEDVSINDKLVLSRDVTDYETMSTEDLIDMKDYLHRILNDRLSKAKEEYTSLDNRINNPNLHALSDDEVHPLDRCNF